MAWVNSQWAFRMPERNPNTDPMNDQMIGVVWVSHYCTSVWISAMIRQDLQKLGGGPEKWSRKSIDQKSLPGHSYIGKKKIEIILRRFRGLGDPYCVASGVLGSRCGAHVNHTQTQHCGDGMMT